MTGDLDLRDLGQAGRVLARELAEQRLLVGGRDIHRRQRGAGAARRSLLEDRPRGVEELAGLNRRADFALAIAHLATSSSDLANLSMSAFEWRSVTATIN